jgi:isocitrate/isopropylmalate dehydrogenase
MERPAEAIEAAIEKVLRSGARTPDLPGRKRPISTSRMGNLIAAETTKFLASSRFRPEEKV